MGFVEMILEVGEVSDDDHVVAERFVDRTTEEVRQCLGVIDEQQSCHGSTSLPVRCRWTDDAGRS